MTHSPEAEAQYRVVIEHFEKLLDSDDLEEWLPDVRTNWPILKARTRRS